MGRTIVTYGVALAAAAALLTWVEYRYLSQRFSTELYIVVLAVAFTALGLWAGTRLTPRHAGSEFARNEAGLRALGLTPRELEILEMLATDQSAKEIARVLKISHHTVKTHQANLYDKLEVRRRIQAIDKAKRLSLIP